MKKKKQINFQAFFFSGIPFIGAGFVFIAAVNRVIGISLIGIGIIFMVLGGKNRDKWDKK